MKLTKEQTDRLRTNLIFDQGDTDGAVGMIQILVRNEDQESVKELFSLIAGILSQSELMVGWDVEIPDFAGKLSTAKDDSTEYYLDRRSALPVQRVPPPSLADPVVRRSRVGNNSALPSPMASTAWGSLFVNPSG